MSDNYLKWIIFFIVVFLAIIIDLGVFNKKDHKIGIKESLITSSVYLTIGMLFGFWIFYKYGSSDFYDYLTCFFVEKSLSLDNIFFISLAFSKFKIPAQYQHRVLFWGIIGVIVLRALMIVSGLQLINKFSWMLYLFSAFLILTGIKMFFEKTDEKKEIKDSFIFKWMQKNINLTKNFYGNKFLIIRKTNNRKTIYFTPLFAALVTIEFADLIFALDSIPAVLVITNNPYIIYTSNIFAIMGLRALFFSLEFILEKFHYMKFALAAVLVFIGAKVFTAEILGIEKIPAVISVGVTLGLLLLGLLFSIYKSPKKVDA